jgi:hypothetical protein
MNHQYGQNIPDLQDVIPDQNEQGALHRAEHRQRANFRGDVVRNRTLRFLSR